MCLYGIIAKIQKNVLRIIPKDLTIRQKCSKELAMAYKDTIF